MSTLDRIRELEKKRRAEAEEIARRSSFSIGGTASRAVQQARGESNVAMPPELGYLQGLAALRARENPWYQNALEGVGSWMRSAGRALEYPFADKERREEMKKEAQWSQHLEEGMPTAFKVGREYPPFAVPPLYKGAALLPQMAESAATSTALNWLDFDKDPAYGPTALNALGAMAAPMITRTVGNLIPGGVPGSAVRKLPEEQRTAAEVRTPRIKRLEEAGIRVLPSERTGSPTLTKAERMVQRGRPGAHRAFDEFRAEQQEKLNSRAASAMGESPLNVRISPDLLNQAGNRLEREFEDIINNSSLTYDKQFHMDLNNIMEKPQIRSYIEEMGDSGAQSVINDWIEKALNQRTIPGSTFQQMERQLKADALDAFSGTVRNPSNWLLGTVYSDIRDALGNAFERQMGKKMRDRYRRVKREYSSYAILSDQKIKNVVDANGNVNPARVTMALDQDKKFRQNFARDLPSHDLSLIKDYHLVHTPPAPLPLSEAKGMGKIAEWFFPNIFGGTIPAKAYLHMGSSLPSPQRSAATGRAGSYLGGRFGGTEMESALASPFLQPEPESESEKATPLLDLLNYIPSWGQSLR